MRYYVVVEGRSTEKEVYKKWIPHVNPTLTHALTLQDFFDNTFFIISGGGYPNYLKVVEDSVFDVMSTNGPVRLVICVDSEDMTLIDKQRELIDIVEEARGGVYIDYVIVVQHFCFEAWALGNEKIGPRHPKDELLKRFKSIHNVLVSDPELLPSLPSDRLNRSQFAAKYLGLLFRDKNKGISYSKSNPTYVAHPTFCEQLQKRLTATGHIGSFRDFLRAFS